MKGFANNLKTRKSTNDIYKHVTGTVTGYKHNVYIG